MTDRRYTISKAVSDRLQSEGWTLKDEYYNDEINCDIYYLEREMEE